jgi:hypothetical protein
MKSISQMSYPMKALGKVEVAGVEYVPGAEFDALTIHSRDYLVAHGAAVDLPPTPDLTGMAHVSDATSDGAPKVGKKGRTSR